VSDREGEADLVILNSSIESPLSCVAKLFDVSQLLLILFFIDLTELLNDFEAGLLDGIILIKEARNHVREKATFVVNLIGQFHQ